MTESPNQPDQFDRLLSEMHRVSKAVNGFTSEKAQLVALRALMHAAGITDASGNVPAATQPALSVVTPLVTEHGPQTHDMSGPDESDASSDAATDAKSNGRKSPRKGANGKKIYPRVKDINFRPEGKPSLRAFFAELEPKNFHEKNMVFVYYLEQHLGIEEVTLGHVLAAYDEIPEKSPTDPENSLRKTAHMTRGLDTASLKAIKTTHAGRNMIEFDMPARKGVKTA